MLKKSPSLTVLVECGFISNQEEADLLAGAEYQKKVAKSICKGIMNYIEKLENPDKQEEEDQDIEDNELEEGNCITNMESERIAKEKMLRITNG